MKTILSITLALSIVGNAYFAFQPYWVELWDRNTDSYYEYRFEPPFGMSGDGWMEFVRTHPDVANEYILQDLTGMKPLPINEEGILTEDSR